MSKLAVLTVAALLSATQLSSAQMSHDHAHSIPADTSGAVPVSPGQETFGAIAEIVAILRDDPATNWARVDLGALRRHLLDMDALVMDAKADEEAIDGGLQITITLSGPADHASARMVPAHAPVLRNETGWSSVAEVGSDAIVWTVTTASAQGTAQIRALGFFGLMATGAHHQAHHLAIARGDIAH